MPTLVATVGRGCIPPLHETRGWIRPGLRTPPRLPYDACVPEPDSDHIRRWARQILLRADPEAAARVFESHYEENTAADITQIAVPTLLIHGENDVIVPVDLARAVAAAIPGAEIVVLPDTGHLPTMTRAQTVVHEIERWAAALATK